MIAPGARVLVRQCGLTAWVVERQEPDGRWHVVSKAVDHKGRSIFSGRTAGEGDMVLIEAAPTYEVGAIVEHDGLSCTVNRDVGDAVECVVPSHTIRTRGGITCRSGRTRRGRCVRIPGTRNGVNLRIPGGNRTTIPKADIVMEALK